MDKKEVERIIEWRKNADWRLFEILDIEEHFYRPLMEAFGDNVEDVIRYLNNLDMDELDYISSSFEFIYKKWMTEYVWDELGKLEDKIKAYKENKKTN